MPRPSSGWIAVLSLAFCVALVALAYREDSRHDIVLEGKTDGKASKQTDQEDDVLNVLQQEAAKASIAAHRAQLRASEAHNLISKETKMKMKTAAEQRDALLRQDKDLHTSTDKAKEAIQNEKQAAARAVVVRREAALAEQIKSLKDKTDAWNKQAAQDRAEATAYMKSAQEAASKETTSQLMRDIMADATFDKQADHVLGVLKQLQHDKEVLETKASEAIKVATSLAALRAPEKVDSSHLEEMKHEANEARARAAASQALLAKVRATATSQEQQKAALKREIEEVAVARKRAAANIAKAAAVKPRPVVKARQLAHIQTKPIIKKAPAVHVQQHKHAIHVQHKDTVKPVHAATHNDHIDAAKYGKIARNSAGLHQVDASPARMTALTTDVERMVKADDSFMQRVYSGAYHDAFDQAYKAVLAKRPEVDTHALAQAAYARGFETAEAAVRSQENKAEVLHRRMELARELLERRERAEMASPARMSSLWGVNSNSFKDQMVDMSKDHSISAARREPIMPVEQKARVTELDDITNQFDTAKHTAALKPKAAESKSKVAEPDHLADFLI